jgi:chaperone modulatory protein CbpM
MNEPIMGDVLDESIEFSLAEICRICGVRESMLVEIVEEGIVEPLGGQAGEWRFSGVAVMRVQRVIRLQREFEVNLPGAALALQLLEEIERLKRGRSG